MAELDTPDLASTAPAPAQGPDSPRRAEPVARSPIAPAEPVTVVDGWQVSAIRADGADLTLTDCTPLAKVAVAAQQPDLRSAPDLRGTLDLRSAPELRGVRFGRAAREGDGTLVVGSGPGEWLLIGPPGQATALAATLGPDVTWVDLTHGRALVRLTGHRAPDVLARLSAVDLDDELVPDGAALRTAVATVATDIIRDDADGTRSYLLHCERSVGQYLFSSLLQAGAEYGLAVDGFRPTAR